MAHLLTGWVPVATAQDAADEPSATPAQPDVAERGAEDPRSAVEAVANALVAHDVDAFARLLDEETVAGSQAPAVLLPALEVKWARPADDPDVTRDGDRATVVMAWGAALDVDAFERALIDHIRSRQQAAGADREAMRRAVDVATAFARTQGAVLADQIAHPRQRVHLHRVDGRWFVTRLLDPLPRENDGAGETDATGDSDGDGLQDPGDDTGADNENVPDELTCGGEKPDDVVRRILEAWKHNQPDEIRWATMPGDLRELANTDPVYIKALSVHEYLIGNVWQRGNRAWVEYQWRVHFHIGDYRDHRLAQVVADAKAAGKSDMAIAMIKAAERDHIDSIKAQIEEARHVMLLERHANRRWYAINQPFHNENPDFDPAYNADGVTIDDHRPVTDPGYTPPESECGGATPEALARRAINAWQTDNTVDVVWCSRPGPTREWYRQQDRTLILCMRVIEWELDDVWVQGSKAWIRYRWRCVLDDNRFYKFRKRQIEQQAANGEMNPVQAQQELENLPQTVQGLKGNIEKPEHIMAISKVGDRWYMAGPFEDRVPTFPPTRKARGPYSADEDEDAGEATGDGADENQTDEGGTDDSDGDGLQDPGDDADDESQNGGSSPEGVVRRVIEAWKKHDSQELWRAAHPDKRDEKKADSTMVECMTIREYSLGKVWVRDDRAWVQYRWQMQFDDRKFYEHQIRDLEEKAKAQGKTAEQIEQMKNLFRQQVLRLKQKIEGGVHIMAVKRHSNGRWYSVGQPFADRAPGFDPVRDHSDDD